MVCGFCCLCEWNIINFVEAFSFVVTHALRPLFYFNTRSLVHAASFLLFFSFVHIFISEMVAEAKRMGDEVDENEHFICIFIFIHSHGIKCLSNFISSNTWQRTRNRPMFTDRMNANENNNENTGNLVVAYIQCEKLCGSLKARKLQTQTRHFYTKPSAMRQKHALLFILLLYIFFFIFNAPIDSVKILYAFFCCLL